MSEEPSAVIPHARSVRGKRPVIPLVAVLTFTYSAPERCNTARCFTTPNREIARSDSRSEMDRSRRSLRASNAAPLCTGRSGGNLVAEVVVPRPSQAIMR